MRRLMSILLLISAGYSVYQSARGKIDGTKKEKIKYYFTLAFSLVVLIFECHFDLVKFWDI